MKSPPPYGCVLIMSPWNYPFLLTIDPLVDAIAAGNTAVVKPSAYAPHTAAAMTEMLESCFSPEFVAVVNGGRAGKTPAFSAWISTTFSLPAAKPSGGRSCGRRQNT